jgi:hypothetical protein
VAARARPRARRARAAQYRRTHAGPLLLLHLLWR